MESRRVRDSIDTTRTLCCVRSCWCRCASRHFSRHFNNNWSRANHVAALACRPTRKKWWSIRHGRVCCTLYHRRFVWNARTEGQTGVELYELNLYVCALAPDHLQMWDSECADGCT